MPPELPAWRGGRRRPTRQILGLGSHRWLSRPTENAEQASTEMEPDKLLDLVTHLNNVLVRRARGTGSRTATSSHRMLFLYRYLKHPCHVSCVLLLGSTMSREVLYAPPKASPRRNSYRAHLPGGNWSPNAAIHPTYPASQANRQTQAPLEYRWNRGASVHAREARIESVLDPYVIAS